MLIMTPDIKCLLCARHPFECLISLLLQMVSHQLEEGTLDTGAQGVTWRHAMYTAASTLLALLPCPCCLTSRGGCRQISVADNLSGANISLVYNVELWHCIQKPHNIILALNEALSFPCILDTNNASFIFFKSCSIVSYHDGFVPLLHLLLLKGNGQFISIKS